MTFEVTFDDADLPIVQDYLKDTNMTISEFARRAMLETIIDDDYCLYLYEKAIEEYKKNPVSIPFAELKKKWQSEY